MDTAMLRGGLVRATLLASLLAASAPAQRQFAEDTKAYVPPIRDAGAAVAAGDLDGDGHLDLVIGNNPLVAGAPDRLYLGDGAGGFADATATHFPSPADTTEGVALGDVDGDGDLDVATASTGQNRLYLNDGSGHLSDATFARLPADTQECRDVVFADVDADGDLDLLFASYRQDLLWRNDGTGRFTDATATHFPVNQTSTWDLAVGDVDGDGDVDVVLAEQNGQKLLRNDGSGHFTDVSSSQLPPTAGQCLAVALCDVDGDLDLDLVCGYYQASASLYRNDGSGRFLDAGPAPLAAALDWLVWSLSAGDVDGDGDADLLVQGWSSDWMPAEQLLRNDGTGSFTDATASLLLQPSTAVSYESLLVDVDADGDLDAVCAAFWSPERVRLNDGSGRLVDAAPARLHGAMDVPRAAVLVDVDGDGDRDLVFANGWWDWTGWPNRLHVNDGRGTFTDVTAARLPEDTADSRAVAAADFDRDGDQDLLFGNYGAQNSLYLNDGTGAFTDATATRLPAAADATTALVCADFDGDGCADVFAGNYLEPCALWTNDGAGTFVDRSATGLPGLGVHEVRGAAAGDVDGDGDLDIVLAIGLALGRQNRLLRNDGAGVFTDVTAAQMPLSLRASACVALGDVDGDGDLDLVFGSTPGPASATNELYLNDGSGTFASSWLFYDLYDTRAIALADVDEDGDLDVLCGDHDHWNKLYLNDGTGVFSDGSARLPGAAENTQALAVGDVDGDGDPDLVCGDEGGLRLESALYLNHHRQISAPLLARVGHPYRLDIAAHAGYATAPQLAAAFLGVAPAAIPLPPFGVLGIDPTAMVVLPGIVLPAPRGTASLVLPIPSTPSVAGIVLHAQALVLPDARLTNVVSDQIGTW